MLELLQSYFSQAPELGFNPFWISQGLICLALGFDIASYQVKKREHVLMFFVVSSVLIAIHLYLLGHSTAAVLMGISATRFFVSIFTTSQKIMYGFMALSIITTLALYQSWLDFWVLTCSLIFTFASFRKSDKVLRQTMMCGTSLWLLYNVVIFSPAAVMLETIFLSSNFIGYYRYYLRPLKNLT